MILISVIVPTLNRPKLLLDLVKKLNPIIKKEHEVIFVDDSINCQKK